jgi:SulP family sulfate permease
MASAVMAGVNPVQGLYAGMIGTPVAALTTSSVYMMVTTTGAISLATGSALIVFPPEQRIPAVATLAIIIGILQIVAGVARLGFLTRFISNAVMTGFLTGVAVVIILSQVPDLTNVQVESRNKVNQFFLTLVNFREIDWRTLSIGIGTIALVLLLERTRVKRIAMLLALIVASVVVQLINWDQVPLVGTSNSIPNTLPDFSLDLVHLPGLFFAAIAIGIIGLVQGAGIAQSYPNPDGKYPNVSRDFWAQGAANVASGAFQGIPVGGSAGSTALNTSAGGKSRWANVFSGLILMAGVLLLGGLIEKIPMSALSALLVIAGFRSINVGRVLTVGQTSVTALTVMAITFLATLTLPVQQAVFLGVGISFLLTVIGSSDKVYVKEIVLKEGELPEERNAPKRLPSNKLTILLPYGSIFFAGARNLEEGLPDADKARRAVVILALRSYHEVGSTFISVLGRYATTIQNNGGKLMLAGVNEEVYKQLEKTGMLKQLGEENVFRASRKLFESSLLAVQAGRAWLAEEEPPEKLEVTIPLNLPASDGMK